MMSFLIGLINFFLENHLIGYYAFLCALVQFTSFLFSSFIIPKFPHLSSKHQHVWYNKTVSTFHAIVMFSRAAYYWLHINKQMIISEKVSDYEAITIDIMMGYLIYDTIYELSNISQGGGLDIPVLLHHGFGFISHFLTRYHNSGASSFYSMMVYLAELSTPFLNISWLLNYLEFSNSLPLTLCGGILLLTFFFSRVLWGPYMLYHMIHYWTQEPQFLYQINFGIVVFFILLNFYWFYALLRLLFVGGKKKKEIKTTTTATTPKGKAGEEVEEISEKSKKIE